MNRSRGGLVLFVRSPAEVCVRNGPEIVFGDAASDYKLHFVARVVERSGPFSNE